MLDLHTLAARLLSPRRFFAPGLTLSFRHDPAERIPWEVFHGRLLDPAHTRRQHTFETWGLHAIPGPPDEALLSLKYDTLANRLHVVRAVEGYAWEGFDAGGGVFESRERRKWIRELIATFDLGDGLEREVELALWRAVVGSRLPLTPIETPLPSFSFGHLVYGPDDFAPTSPDELLSRWLAPAKSHGHRILEAWLRASTGDPSALQATGLSPEALIGLVRRMFDDISLSPWTPFVPRLLDALDALVERGWMPLPLLVDFHSSLLRLLGRHLTAYDLVTFHHRGANYPDALLLDLVFRRYLARIEQTPELFETNRLRRRALRQAVVLRRRYEGHPVPEVPTSPGERMRVYPEGMPRVSEEQILQPARRRVYLFHGEPTFDLLGPIALRILRQGVEDLHHREERQELGAAVYLDRPLGGAKATVEPDGTPLVASLAFSAAIAEQRLRLLGSDLVADFDIPGIPVAAIGPGRQGSVSLADAGRVSADFVFRHTLPGSRREFLAAFDWAPLAGRVDLASRTWLLAAGPQGGLRILDRSGETILEFEAAYEEGYRSRGGVEIPRAGLRVTRIGEERLADTVRIRIVSEDSDEGRMREARSKTGDHFR